MIEYSIQFNGADGDYTNASVLRSIDGSTPSVIPATITTYGVGGDYADPILAASAVGSVDDGKIQVLVEISDVTMNGLFRPNQTWPNLGVFIGDTKITGESLVGRTLSNLASSRFCLAPSPNVSFQDLYISNGGVSKDRAFQNVNGNAFTRIISTDETSGGSINPTTNSTGTTLNNCVVHNVVQDGSSVEGAVTINNTLVIDRIIARANNLLTFANSISLASDWYLGRPNDSGAESLVTNSRILQNAPADEFGPGSTGNVVNYDATSDFVNLLIGDYRISTESPLHALNIGPFFEESGGGGVSGDVELSVDEVKFVASGSATLPQPIATINFAINKIEFASIASATLPNPSGDIGFDLSQVEFSSTGGATLPQPVGEIDFDLLSIYFTGIGSATVPFPIGTVSFDIALIEFNATGSSTQPNPIGGVEFDISTIGFTGSGGASLPFPVGSALFEVAQVEFSGTGEVTFPQPSGNADFDIDEIGFYATGSATQPDSVGDIAFDITPIEFSAIGSVTGVTLPFGEVILPAYTSNVIILNTPPNLIKL